MRTVICKPNGNNQYCKDLWQYRSIEPPIWQLILADYYETDLIIDAEADNLSHLEIVRKAVNEMKADRIVILASGSHPSGYIQQKDEMIKLSCILDSYKVETILHSKLPIDPTKYRVKWDLIDLNKYRASNWHSFSNNLEVSPYGVNYSSISCPFKCSFCTVKNFYGEIYKERLIEDVTKDFDELAKRNVVNIKMMDELFIAKPQRVHAICDDIIGRGYNFNIWAYARIDIMNEQLLKKLKRAGVNWLAYGIECLDPDTIVLTTEGIKKIKDVKINDSIVSYDVKNKQFVTNKVSNKINNIKNKLKLITDTEEIIASEEHRFFTINSYGEIQEKQTKDIKEKDIVLSTNKNGIDLDKEFIHPDVAQLIGFIIGDGYIKDNQYSIFISGKYKELLDYYFKIGKKHFKCSGDVKYDIKRRQWTLRLTGKHTIYKFICELGLNHKKSFNKFTPDIINKSSNKVIGSYLAGLFDSDGCIYYNQEEKCNFNCYISLNNLNLIKEIKYLLLYRLGIESSLIKTHVDKRYSVDKYQYTIRIRKIKSIRNLASTLPLKNIHRKKHLNNYLKDSVLIKNSDYLYIPQKLIEQYSKLNIGSIRKLDKKYKNIRTVLYLSNTKNKFIRSELFNGFISSIENGDAKSNKLINNYITLIKSGVNFSLIQKKEKINNSHDVIDLTIENTHTYLANGFIVHNSGNDEIRQKALKGSFTKEKIKEVIQMTKDAGINIIGNFMFGFWEDNNETMQETLDLAIDLNCEYINFYCITAFPETKFYDEMLDKGVSLPTSWSQYAQVSEDFKALSTRYLKAEEVLLFRDKAFQSYFRRAEYLDMIEEKFGKKTVDHIDGMLHKSIRRLFI